MRCLFYMGVLQSYMLVIEVKVYSLCLHILCELPILCELINFEEIVN